MPYQNREMAKAKAREGMRKLREKRRAERPVMPEIQLARDGTAPNELLGLVLDELAEYREIAEPGAERCRVIVALVNCCLKCHEQGDLLGRLEAVEQTVAAGSEKSGPGGRNWGR